MSKWLVRATPLLKSNSLAWYYLRVLSSTVHKQSKVTLLQLIINLHAALYSGFAALVCKWEATPVRTCRKDTDVKKTRKDLREFTPVCVQFICALVSVCVDNRHCATLFKQDLSRQQNTMLSKRWAKLLSRKKRCCLKCLQKKLMRNIHKSSGSSS